MALIRAYAADFSPETGAPMRCAAGNQIALGDITYEPVRLFRHADGWSYCMVKAKLWKDGNHSQRTFLYLPMICDTKGRGGSEVPDAKKIPAGLNLVGAEIRTSMAASNLHLSKDVQIVNHAQWFDTEANDGRGTSVNYIHVGGPTICEALGAPTPYNRPAAGFAVTGGWVDHVTRFDPEDSAWICIGGNAAKVEAGVYGESASKRDAFGSELLNLQVVFHCGPTTPDVPPMNRPDGGLGELYCRKFELWIDPVLNPQAVAA